MVDPARVAIELARHIGQFVARALQPLGERGGVRIEFRQALEPASDRRKDRRQRALGAVQRLVRLAREAHPLFGVRQEPRLGLQALLLTGHEGRFLDLRYLGPQVFAAALPGGLFPRERLGLDLQRLERSGQLRHPPREFEGAGERVQERALSGGADE